MIRVCDLGMPFKNVNGFDTSSDTCDRTFKPLPQSAEHNIRLPIIKVNDPVTPSSTSLTQRDTSQLTSDKTPKGRKPRKIETVSRKRKCGNTDASVGSYVCSTPILKRKATTKTLEKCVFVISRNATIVSRGIPDPDTNGSYVFDLDESDDSYKSLNMADASGSSLTIPANFGVTGGGPTPQDIMTFLEQMDTGNQARDKELKTEMSRGNEAIKLDIAGINEKIENMKHEAFEAETRTANKIAALEEEFNQFKHDRSTFKPTCDCMNRLAKLEAAFTDMGNHEAPGSTAVDAGLLEKVEKLSNTLEMQERAARKKNIIIRGWKGPLVNFKQETYNFLLENFSLPENFAEDISLQGKEKKVIRVKLREFADKIKILNSKREVLKRKNVFIDSDLTKLERDIQIKLRECANTERLNKRDAWVSYGKVVIEEQPFRWDQATSKLVPIKPKSNAGKPGSPSFYPAGSQGKGPPQSVHLNHPHQL